MRKLKAARCFYYCNEILQFIERNTKRSIIVYKSANTYSLLVLSLIADDTDNVEPT